MAPSPPPRPRNIGKRRFFSGSGGTRRYFTVADEIVRAQHTVGEKSRKLIYFQKIVFENGRHVEYRFTYYMLGVKPKAKGRWVFGQYSLLLPAKHLRSLLVAARARGWTGV